MCNGTTGELLSQLVDLLKLSGARHTILYASQPSGYLLENPSGSPVARHLAERTNGTKTGLLSKCDGECLVKSTLLEGTFVVSRLPVLCFIARWFYSERGLACRGVGGNPCYVVSVPCILVLYSHACLLCAGNSAPYHLDIRAHVYDGNRYSLQV